MSLATEKQKRQSKEHPEPPHSRNRNDSTNSDYTIPFPTVQVKTPSQTVSQGLVTKPESAPLYKVPTSPLIRPGANVGRRRANAISLMDSPARQGHCHEMARIFREAQDTIAAQDAIHTPAPLSPRGATLFGSTPRRKLDLQKQRTRYQTPNHTNVPVMYPKLPRLDSDLPVSTTAEGNQPAPDILQIKRESSMAIKKYAQKPLPGLPVHQEEPSQHASSEQCSDIETWLRGISEDDSKSEMPGLAATLRLPSPSLSYHKENHGPFHTSHAESRIPAKVKAAACLNALFSKSLAEDDDRNMPATTPTSQELSRWIPRRVPKRLRKKTAAEITEASSMRKPAKFEVGPPQTQSSSSESLDASTPTVRILSTESGANDYHLGECLKQTSSIVDEATPNPRRGSSVALSDGKDTFAHRTPLAKSFDTTETKPLTPDVETYRKGDEPPRRRCASYFDEDIITFPKLKNGYIEMEKATV